MFKKQNLKMKKFEKKRGPLSNPPHTHTHRTLLYRTVPYSYAKDIAGIGTYRTVRQKTTSGTYRTLQVPKDIAGAILAYSSVQGIPLNPDTS